MLKSIDVSGKDMVNILVVDDEEFNLTLIERIFEEQRDTRVLKAKNGKEAVDILSHMGKEIDIVLMDIVMPEMDGLTALKIIRSDDRFKHLPIIIVTSNRAEKVKALKLGATDFISKPFDPSEIKLRVKNYVELKKYTDYFQDINSYLEKQVQERTKQLMEALKLAKEAEREIAIRLGKAAEFRDIETGQHILRVSYYSKRLAELVGLPKEDVDLIFFASPLHDVGKVGIPDVVLLKPGKLTKEEFEIVKNHTLIGERILEGADRYPILRAGRIIAGQHHEKWDGTGYPRGLKATDIHTFGRITAIVDVFDALITKRIYKPAYSLEKTVEIMKANRGSHFDPYMLDVFLDNINDFVEIKNRFSEDR